MLSYMYRHLPPAPPSKYWVTGNYIFDYRDSKFGIGAMLQAFLIGDPKSDQPVVAYFKFDTETLGRFTGQLGVLYQIFSYISEPLALFPLFQLYLKIRGVSDQLFKQFFNPTPMDMNSQTLGKILESMKAPLLENTPMHVELILQMEGKTVLSYHINEKMFRNLTYSDSNFPYNITK